MNRLWYVWTAGHGGANGGPPSGPIRQRPVLAASEEDARKEIEPLLTSWDGPIMVVTTNEDYAPRMVYLW